VKATAAPFDISWRWSTPCTKRSRPATAQVDLNKKSSNPEALKQNKHTMVEPYLTLCFSPDSGPSYAKLCQVAATKFQHCNHQIAVHPQLAAAGSLGSLGCWVKSEMHPRWQLADGQLVQVAHVLEILQLPPLRSPMNQRNRKKNIHTGFNKYGL
jgi:hypothetical protein